MVLVSGDFEVLGRIIHFIKAVFCCRKEKNWKERLNSDGKRPFRLVSLNFILLTVGN
jgi:hypothetical protein